MVHNTQVVSLSVPVMPTNSIHTSFAYISSKSLQVLRVPHPPLHPAPPPSPPLPLLPPRPIHDKTTLASTVHRDLHASQQALQHAKRQTKSDLEDQAGDNAQDISVTVQHFPLYVCPLTNAAFVLPSSSPIAAARSVLHHLASGDSCYLCICNLLQTKFLSGCLNTSLAVSILLHLH